MDIIHRPEQREEISEKIHLKTYFDGYAKLIHEGNFDLLWRLSLNLDCGSVAKIFFHVV